VLLMPLAALVPLTLSAQTQTSKGPGKQTAPAKNLDIGLLKQAPKMVMFLSEKGYKNIGVLPFKVKKGTREAGFYSGPLGTTLPGRLENALIMSMGDDESVALNIIRDAGGAASQQKVGRWLRDRTAFNKLFAASYPVAWGNKKVRPDVFLTGTISNTGNRATTTVEVLGFDKDSWMGGSVKAFRVTQFTVKTDRALLRDLGYSYALARSALRRDATAEDRDEQALAQVNKEEGGQKPPQGGQTAHSPTLVAGMAFEIYYNGVRQTIRPLSENQEEAKSPLFQVDPAPPGARVLLVLTRVSDENRRLGVCLKLNGQSTFQLDDRDPMQCRKWLYDLSDRGKPDKLHGVWMDTKGTVQPFRVLTAEESAARANELGERAGWIDLDVFASGEGPAQPEEQMMVSTRGLARGSRKFSSLKALQQRLMKVNNVRHRKTATVRRTGGGLIVPDPEPVPGVSLETGELPNPVRLGGISIKYYDRSAMKVSE
jgi:hypothetical protein